MGQFQFNNNTNNPLNTNFAFSNARARRLPAVHRDRAATATRTTSRWWSEWYAQDTWQATPRLTVDYGLRFLVYTPYWRPDEQIANFDPAQYNRAERAAALPAGAGQRHARRVRPGDRADRSTRSSSAPTCPAPATQANGMVLQTDPGVPRGFREMLAPQLGAARRASRGISPARARRCCTRAPACSTTRASAADRSATCAIRRSSTTRSIPNNTMANDVRAGRDAGRTARRRSKRSRRDYKTPSSLQLVDRPAPRHRLGHRRRRDLCRQRRPQPRDVLRPQRGARRRAVPRPASRQPRSRQHESATAVLPDEFLRPYSRLPEHPRARQFRHRRLPFAAGAGEPPLHPRRAVRRRLHAAAGARPRRRGSGQPVDHAQPPAATSSTASSRRATGTSWSINYSWDISRSASRTRSRTSARRLAALGRERVRHRRLGAGRPHDAPTTSTSRAAKAGKARDLGGGLRNVAAGHDVRSDGAAPAIRSPAGSTRRAFTRPSGRGDYGNAPRNAVRSRASTTGTWRSSRISSCGGAARFQFRCEIYNVLNKVQFNDIDRTARVRRRRARR